MPDTDQKTKRPRSRAHPLIDLQESVSKAGALFKALDMQWAPISAALEIMGYSSMTGRAGRVLSALTQYGLLDERGSKQTRQVRVSELARHILAHPEPRERVAARQKAALLPTMHREIWERHPDSMFDARPLEWELVDDRKELTRKAAKNFISNLFATLEFAKLADGRILAAGKSDTEPDGAPTVQEKDEKPQFAAGDFFEGMFEKPPPPPAITEMPTLEFQAAQPFDMPVFLPTGEKAILRMPDWQTEATFDALVKALNTQLELAKPGLTRKPPETANDDGS